MKANYGNYAADQMESAAQAATESGMVVFAASGDNDSSDGGQTPANVDIPSSCPHVIGCGGTTKTLTSESVWNWDEKFTRSEIELLKLWFGKRLKQVQRRVSES
jgi:subtilase family serine protease